MNETATRVWVFFDAVDGTFFLVPLSAVGTILNAFLVSQIYPISINVCSLLARPYKIFGLILAWFLQAHDFFSTQGQNLSISLMMIMLKGHFTVFSALDFENESQSRHKHQFFDQHRMFG